VEAKGYTEGGTVDTERGIVQAYDRLAEANAAYLAARTAAVSETDRTLARELNVGVLGVTGDGHVEALEVPRVVGNRTQMDDWQLETSGNPYDSNIAFYRHVSSRDEIDATIDTLVDHFAEFGREYASEADAE
jgi:hypothetical protein